MDRKTPLDILAESIRLSMPELIKEMESLVYSGTKLKVDYYLDDQYDPDLVDDVWAYFQEVKDDSVKLAMKEFSDDEEYPEEMLRLVRIKFVSEKGN